MSLLESVRLGSWQHTRSRRGDAYHGNERYIRHIYASKAAKLDHGA